MSGLSELSPRTSTTGDSALVAITECPFLRDDGSIVDQRGYDAATGIYYRPGIPFLLVPDRPTREDAQAAAVHLFELIRQFPFASDADRAVWLSGFLTPIARPAIEGPVPGHAVIGNKAGTGKGLLLDLISLGATGRVAPTSNYPADPVEAGKVKVALALSPRVLVHFDNLDEGSMYGNSGIDSAITSSLVNDRVLGSSKMTGDLPWKVCCYLSGNNLSPAKDAYRRWLVGNLFTDEEHPEERKDLEIADLRAHMLEHRAEFVRDALVILRSYALAGGPTADGGRWDHSRRGTVLSVARSGSPRARIAAQPSARPPRIRRSARPSSRCSEGGASCRVVGKVNRRHRRQGGRAGSREPRGVSDPGECPRGLQSRR